MDGGYLREDESKNKYLVIAGMVLFIFLIAGVVYFFIQKNRQLVSPIPPKPSFEVIFFTPSPEPVTPTSTPSATPKGQKATSTPRPTLNVTVTPTAKQATPSPTVKNTTTPTLTPKP